MRKISGVLVIIFGMVLAGCQGSAPTAGGTAEEGTTETIELGHLTYHTGPFGHVGKMFDASVDFTLDLINNNPPLEKEVISMHQDIGTLGEGQIARKLVESENVDILYNVAMEYMSYRDWLVKHEEENNGPLLPSIHAGAIAPQYGGVATEPIFRGSPMDTDQGLAATLYLSSEGAKKIVIVASENDGMQMQLDAAVKASEALGMEVLSTIDLLPEQTSYRNEVSRILAQEPDGLIMFAPAEDAGTFVKNASEMGLSTMIVGDTNFLFEEFVPTATPDAIKRQKFVKAVGFSNSDGPAWDYFNEAWENSEYATVADPSNPYVLAAYDNLNLTMLAIEKANSLNSDKWVDAMYEVAMEPGKKVYTYEEGITALRNGEEIDYEGVTGSLNYTDTGVVGGLYQIYDYSTGEIVKDSMLEGQDVLDLAEKIN